MRKQTSARRKMRTDLGARAGKGSTQYESNTMKHSANTALSLLREIYEDVVQGAIPNDDDPWFEKTKTLLDSVMHINEQESVFSVDDED